MSTTDGESVSESGDSLSDADESEPCGDALGLRRLIPGLPVAEEDNELPIDLAPMAVLFARPEACCFFACMDMQYKMSDEHLWRYHRNVLARCLPWHGCFRL